MKQATVVPPTEALVMLGKLRHRGVRTLLSREGGDTLPPGSGSDHPSPQGCSPHPASHHTPAMCLQDSTLIYTICSSY